MGRHNSAYGNVHEHVALGLHRVIIGALLPFPAYNRLNQADRSMRIGP